MAAGTGYRSWPASSSMCSHLLVGDGRVPAVVDEALEEGRHVDDLRRAAAAGSGGGQRRPSAAATFAPWSGPQRTVAASPWAARCGQYLLRQLLVVTSRSCSGGAPVLAPKRLAGYNNWCTKTAAEGTHGPMSPHVLPRQPLPHPPAAAALPVAAAAMWAPAASCCHAAAIIGYNAQCCSGVRNKIKHAACPTRSQRAGLPCIHAMLRMCMFRGRACRGTLASGRRGC